MNIIIVLYVYPNILFIERTCSSESTLRILPNKGVCDADLRPLGGGDQTVEYRGEAKQ